MPIGDNELGNPIFSNLLTDKFKISGKYSKEYFRKTGELRHITKVNHCLNPRHENIFILNIAAEALAPV